MQTDPDCRALLLEAMTYHLTSKLSAQPLVTSDQARMRTRDNVIFVAGGLTQVVPQIKSVYRPCIWYASNLANMVLTYWYPVIYNNIHNVRPFNCFAVFHTSTRHYILHVRGTSLITTVDLCTMYVCLFFVIRNEIVSFHKNMHSMLNTANRKPGCYHTLNLFPFLRLM